MKKRCLLRAPAKLNLHLQVGARRSDGFHDINSLFVMISLNDEIDAGSLKTGNDCRIKGNFNFAVEDNLIYKAWTEFCLEVGEPLGVEFNLRKNIPVFAGLGGGSSDAASALRAMNLLFETEFDDGRLAEIGGRIGSDVPFFLTAAAAVIEGRGEKVTRITPVVHDFVLVHPEIAISTKEAYNWIDHMSEGRKHFMSGKKMLEIYNGGPAGYKAFSNDFSLVLRPRFGIFSEIIDALESEGAVYSNVTGSGSAVFGVFESEKTAEKAKNTLQNRYKFVQKIKSLDRIPNAILE